MIILFLIFYWDWKKHVKTLFWPTSLEITLLTPQKSSGKIMKNSRNVFLLHCIHQNIASSNSMVLRDHKIQITWLKYEWWWGLLRKRNWLRKGQFWKFFYYYRTREDIGEERLLFRPPKKCLFSTNLRHRTMNNSRVRPSERFLDPQPRPSPLLSILYMTKFVFI